MLQTLALALVFGTTVLFSSLYAYATDHDESTGNGIDLSGVGHCSGRTLNVTAAWSWTQYPSSPSVTEVSEVPDGFVGRNAIVWTGEGTFDEFVVRGVDGMLVTADKDLNSDGICHFTLDWVQTPTQFSSKTCKSNETMEDCHPPIGTWISTCVSPCGWTASASCVKCVS
jgi:hypothetical protein